MVRSAGAAALGAGVSGCGKAPEGRAASTGGLPRSGPDGSAVARRAREAARVRPFAGDRQAGVSTPQQSHVLLLAYDLAEPRPAALRTTLGRFASALPGLVEEARRAALTVTVAVGPGLLRTARVPHLPVFAGDRLDPAGCGGDLLVQFCAADPATVAGAAGELTRRTAGGVRWRQPGFLPPTPPGQTPRNVLGFKDGTANPAPEECEHWVWDSRGGTYLVVRRVHVGVADFAALPLSRQEEVIGRHRADGAPLGGSRERDRPDMFAKTPQGRYVIPPHAHIRAAAPHLDGGARMLRRGYSYDNGADDRGLLFLAYMRDPALFVRVQQRLAERDELSRFIEHRGSAVGYVLPGAAGRPLGAGLV
ncbi:Dyp-type peroxidase [Streptomyces sp. CoH27]|uniref:Dyp-type peroxidase n=1 Tax=Streptomyces sp. CoH27 TaxID=2875763 RepID=UPI001CD4E2BD|nr:Dyp-type peroxidase [Streptomyces sp. CoH27]